MDERDRMDRLWWETRPEYEERRRRMGELLDAIDERAMVEESGEREHKIPRSTKIWGFLTGRTKAGKTTGLIFDVVLLPFRKLQVVRDALSLTLQPTGRPMLRNILSVRKLIVFHDEDGNFSKEELLSSVAQLVIAIAMVWVLVELGLWAEFKELIISE